MADADGVFTQFYEHMRLPEYFGWNWGALRDCLLDLSWLPATHFLLTIDDAEFVLSGSSGERGPFYNALVDAAKYWAAKPELPGQVKTSFRTVLLCSPRALSELSGEMTIRDHQELDVTVVAVARVGVMVEAAGGTGFIDQLKHPSWWDENIAPPRVGDQLHVVVLDASREPPRFSALRRDIDIARRLRDAGP